MKKFILPLIILLLTFSLVGCAWGDRVSDSETETHLETAPETMPWEASDIPHYERPFREIADKALMEKFALTNLSPYEIDVTFSDSGHRIRYRLYIQEYRTDESYTVYLTPDDKVDRIEGSYGQYARYLQNATAEAVAAAKARLLTQFSSLVDHNSPYYYLTIDSEGYLCLSAEIIVDLESSPLGHEHRFFSEPICNAK